MKKCIYYDGQEWSKDNHIFGNDGFCIVCGVNKDAIEMIDSINDFDETPFQKELSDLLKNKTA